MKRKVFSILLMGVLVVCLTACGGEKGDSRFDYIIKELNTAVDESFERNDAASVAMLEERLMQDISSARIIACGNEKFTKDVDLTKTSYTRNLDGYNGKIIYASDRLSKDNVKYCLVFATNARGYLNITVKFNDNKPVFSIPVVLNG